MKKYKILYQWGMNRLIVYVDAESKEQAEYLFYMQYGPNDILSIEEVTDEVIT